MKNLLFLGAVGGMSFSTRLAKSLGYRVVIADFYEKSQAKQFADKSYLVSTTDLDALKGIIADEKIDGIFTGFSDVNIRSAAQLCRYYDMPCYINEEQLLLLQNKLEFNRICQKYGINVPKTYSKDEQIDYPVIVKPSDSYASKGITVCQDPEELDSAFQKALEASRNGKVIIEDYLEGREIMIHYVMLNGRLKISSAYDRIKGCSFTETKESIAPLLIYNHDHFADLVIPYEKNLENMFRDLGFDNLIGFLQGIYYEDKVYFFEPAVRFGGNTSEIFNYYCNKVDIIGKFIEYSHEGRIRDDDLDRITPYFGKFCCNLSLFLKPGTVSSIEGQEITEKIDGVVDFQRYCSEGMITEKDKGNSWSSVGFRIIMILNEKSDLKDRIEQIKDHLHVYDEKGTDMINWEVVDKIEMLD